MDGGKWFWNRNQYTKDDEILLNYILEERVMKVLILDFEKIMNYG